MTKVAVPFWFRLALMGGIVATCAIAATAFLAVQNGSDTIRQEVLARNETSARTVAEAVSAHLVAQRESLRSLCDDLASSDDIDRSLRDFLSRNSAISSTRLYDGRGTLRSGWYGWGLFKEEDAPAEPDTDALRTLKEFYVVSAIKFDTRRYPYAPFVTILMRTSDSHVVAVDIPFREIESHFSRAASAPASWVTLVDDAGRIVLHTEPGREGNTLIHPLVQRAVEGYGGATERAGDLGGYWAIPWRPRMAVVVARPASAALAPIRDFGRRATVIGVFSIGLAVILSFLFSRTATRPLTELTRATVRVGEGDLSARVEIRRQDEFGVLAAAFNRMVEGLRAKQELLPYIPETLWRFAHRRAEGKAETATVKTLTILFCDLRGFTRYSEDRKAEEIVSFLNRFFGAASDAVRKEGGAVDKFIGDACLAIFDLPEGDGAPAAVRAGLAISRFIAGDAEARSGGVGVRVGIHTGEVVLGEVGSGDRRDYTVIGSEVNKSQRIEAACEQGFVYLSDEAASRLAGTGLVVEQVAPIEVKGFRHPIGVRRVQVG